MINLISNSLKFTFEHTGIVELKMSKINEDYIKCSIIDNGLGINESDLTNLGKMFNTIN